MVKMRERGPSETSQTGYCTGCLTFSREKLRYCHTTIATLLKAVRYSVADPGCFIPDPDPNTAVR
jgi:hypothetical protein